MSALSNSIPRVLNGWWVPGVDVWRVSGVGCRVSVMALLWHCLALVLALFWHCTGTGLGPVPALAWSY